MAADRRAAESGELRALHPQRRTRRGPYQHRADGGCGDRQSTHHHCERCVLAGRHGTPAHHRRIRTCARPLCRNACPLARRERGSGGEAHGRDPQNDAHAGAATRGPSPGDAAQGPPGGWGRRGHYDLRPADGDGSLDVSTTLAAPRRHPARDREWGIRRRERTGRPRSRAGESGTRRGTTVTAARTDPDLLYVGTYTDSIYLVRMDRTSGELVRVGSVDAGPNPSFLTLHPDGRVLYGVKELERGALSAFAIERATGALTRLNEQPSGGGAPCFVSVDRTGRVAL